MHLSPVTHGRLAALLAAMIVCGATAAPSSAALVAHWKLDDNAASTTVVATVGSDGTLQGGDNTSDKATTGPGGSITGALQLNGSDDYVSLASVNPGGTSSYSVWFKCDVTASAFTVLGGSSSGANQFIYANSDTTIVTRGGATPSASFTVPAMGTTWHHLLVVWTNSGVDCRVFLDGTESASGTQATSSNLTLTKIGARAATPANFFDGAIAQVKVYNTDESANVATLYAEGTGGGGSAMPVIFRNWLNHSSIAPKPAPVVRAGLIEPFAAKLLGGVTP